MMVVGYEDWYLNMVLEVSRSFFVFMFFVLMGLWEKGVYGCGSFFLLWFLLLLFCFFCCCLCFCVLLFCFFGDVIVDCVSSFFLFCVIIVFFLWILFLFVVFFSFDILFCLGVLNGVLIVGWVFMWVVLFYGIVVGEWLEKGL